MFMYTILLFLNKYDNATFSFVFHIVDTIHKSSTMLAIFQKIIPQ